MCQSLSCEPTGTRAIFWLFWCEWNLISITRKTCIDPPVGSRNGCREKGLCQTCQSICTLRGIFKSGLLAHSKGWLLIISVSCWGTNTPRTCRAEGPYECLLRYKMPLNERFELVSVANRRGNGLYHTDLKQGEHELTSYSSSVIQCCFNLLGHIVDLNSWH